MTSLSVNSISSAARSVTGAITKAVPAVTVNSRRANKTIAWIGKKSHQCQPKAGGVPDPSSGDRGGI